MTKTKKKKKLKPQEGVVSKMQFSFKGKNFKPGHQSSYSKKIPTLTPKETSK